MKLILLLAALALPLTTGARADDAYDKLISQADEAVRSGNLLEGLSLAQQAIKRDAAQHRGHYYAAYALFKQNLPDRAEAFVTEALRLAPADEKADVEKLVKAIADFKKFLVHLKGADQALEDGLAAKAAREYTAAFLAFPARTDIGFKAAKLWLDRSDALEAGRVLNRMKAQPLDAEAAARANQMLAAIAQPLEQAFEQQANAGWAILDAGRPTADALTRAAQQFTAALDARSQVKPGGSDLDAERSPYIGLALTAAAANDVPGALLALRRASKAGLKVDGDYFASALWNPVRKDARFREFLTDAFGASVAEQAASASASAEPFVNSLGMKFVPVPRTQVLFSIWDIRVQDYATYAAARGGVDDAWRKPGFPQDDTHPVVKVNWDDAKAFCAWLTEKEQREGRLQPGQRYRLPTDLEWSAAVGLPAEAGATPSARDGKVPGVYPWGKQWPPPRGAGNYAQSLNVEDYKYTSPVGSFAANRLGLYDMGGNVWQWCEDFYDGSSGARVLRGGSWADYGSDILLSSFRYNLTAVYRYFNVGFRCVLVGVSSR